MGNIFNILVTGVGGQGTILIGDILRAYGLKCSIIQNVVGTETRGVAQREGSVVVTVRYLIETNIYSLGDNYDVDELISPLIPTNDAHIVLGLEPLETLRNLKYISEQTVVVLNTHEHYPKNIIINSKMEKAEKEKYFSNKDTIDLLNQFARKVIALDFNLLSNVNLKSSIYFNIIALAVAVKEFREIFDKNLIIDILREYFKDAKENLNAFELGYNLIKD
jgi:Pyruvate/2-oxoacid:ferredoxin oxidoreductase gamma subunit